MIARKKARWESPNLKIKPITPPIEHSEAVHWDKNHEVLFYLDLHQATVYCYNPKTNVVAHHKLKGKRNVGTIIPIVEKENEFVVTAERSVLKFKWDHKSNDSGTVIEEIVSVDADKQKNEFHDGKIDAHGRLWSGTVHRQADNTVVPYDGSLYSIDKQKTVIKQISGTSYGNGFDWSSDNKFFFFCDGEIKSIVEYEYDLENAKLGQSRKLFRLNDHPDFEHSMGGLTLDAEDNLWVALLGDGGIIHVNGKTGHLLKYVELPVSYCTSLCFGGENLNILYVTTSKLRLSKEQQNKEPMAGSVLEVQGLDVTGLAQRNCIL